MHWWESATGQGRRWPQPQQLALITAKGQSVAGHKVASQCLDTKQPVSHWTQSSQSVAGHKVASQSLDTKRPVTGHKAASQSLDTKRPVSHWTQSGQSVPGHKAASQSLDTKRHEAAKERRRQQERSQQLPDHPQPQASPVNKTWPGLCTKNTRLHSHQQACQVLPLIFPKPHLQGIIHWQCISECDEFQHTQGIGFWSTLPYISAIAAYTTALKTDR